MVVTLQSQTGNHPKAQPTDDSVAQLVEQMTLNHWVVGSSPTGVTSRMAMTSKSLKLNSFSDFFFYPTP